jgi:hypothetical protein
MTMPKSTTPSPAEVAAVVIEKASKEGRRVIDGAEYHRPGNSLIIKCGPLWLSIDANAIRELSGILPDDLAQISLSPGGTTIKLEKYNVYIEAASLVAEFLSQMSSRRTGGFIMDLLEHRV